MPASRRARLLALLTSALTVLTVAAGPARAAGFHPLRPSDGVRLPSGARKLGAVPKNARLNATVALTPRDAQGLAAYAAAVSNPRSPLYHDYLSVRGFARRFAPAPGAVRAVRARLRAQGLSVGVVSPNGLSLPIQGRAAVADAALSTSVDRFAVNGQVKDFALRPARVGGGLDDLVQGVVGLGSAAPGASLSVGHAIDAHLARTRAAAGLCSAGQAAAAGSGSYTPTQIASAYGMSNLRAAGDLGAGVTIALYELEPFSASDVAAYQSCLGSTANVVTEAVDGGAGSGAGSGEAAMDVEDLIGLAPQATIRVYEGPQTATGAYDTYAAIVADDATSVISSSWGLCEALAGTATTSAEATLLQEAAVQGQTFVAASGDGGADDCGGGVASVDDPASQAWATAVGGTSLHGHEDVVWNDSLGAGGGGASSLWARPSWQTMGTATTREVPDVSADADPDTGYLAYYAGAWRTVGGTSVAAPTVAALAALADASPACGGRRLGFLDPALYAAAAQRYGADFRDVTSGGISYDGVPGAVAGVGYDMASGLGTPNAGLVPSLCEDSVTLAPTGAHRWSTASPVSLGLSGESQKALALTYTASGLPAGVTIAASTGLIAGTPTRSGSFTVTVTAFDASGASATARFPVTVSRPAARRARSRAARRSPVQRRTRRVKRTRRGDR